MKTLGEQKERGASHATPRVMTFMLTLMKHLKDNRRILTLSVTEILFKKRQRNGVPGALVNAERIPLPSLIKNLSLGILKCLAEVTG